MRSLAGLLAGLLVGHLAVLALRCRTQRDPAALRISSCEIGCGYLSDDQQQDNTNLWTYSSKFLTLRTLTAPSALRSRFGTDR